MSSMIFEYVSGALMRTVRVRIVLPHEEMHPDRSVNPPWRTLYFLHGITANSTSMYGRCDFATLSDKYGIAIVTPDGENSFYMDCPERRALYETYVARELVETTRKLLPLSRKREDTWIGGISMGGYGALMLGFRHPETFSKIAAISPACQIYDMVRSGILPPEMIENIFKGEERYMEDYDPYTLAVRAKERGEESPKLFMRCGTDDYLVYGVCRDLRDKWEKAGVPLDYDEGPGAHDYEFWNPRLREAMEFLTGDIES